mgnify:FL=1|tara:strand:- start:251 stop:565 length:315 start_codon:yes stop_codon:yes gene_type:complete
MNYTVTTEGRTSPEMPLESLLTAISSITAPYTIEESTPALEALQKDTDQMNPVMKALDTLADAYTTGDQAAINKALDDHQAASFAYLWAQEAASTAVRNTSVWS